MSITSLWSYIDVYAHIGIQWCSSTLFVVIWHKTLDTACQLMCLRVLGYVECTRQNQLDLAGENATATAAVAPVGPTTDSFPGYNYITTVLPVSLGLFVFLVLVVLGVTCIRRHGNRHRCRLDVLTECMARISGSPTPVVNSMTYPTGACSAAHHAWMQSTIPAPMYDKTSKRNVDRKERNVDTSGLKYEDKRFNKPALGNSGTSNTSTVCMEANDGVNEFPSAPKAMQSERQLERHMPPLEFARDHSLLTEEQNPRPPVKFVRYCSLLPDEDKGNQMPTPKFDSDASFITVEDKDRQMHLRFVNDPRVPPEEQKDNQMPHPKSAKDPSSLLIHRRKKKEMPRNKSDFVTDPNSLVQHRQDYRQMALLSGLRRSAESENPGTTEGNGRLRKRIELCYIGCLNECTQWAPDDSHTPFRLLFPVQFSSYPDVRNLTAGRRHSSSKVVTFTMSKLDR